MRVRKRFGLVARIICGYTPAMVTKPTGQPRGRPATGETPIRRARVPDPLWQAAVEVATGRGETATDAVITGLHLYIAKYGRKPDA